MHSHHAHMMNLFSVWTNENRSSEISQYGKLSARVFHLIELYKQISSKFTDRSSILLIDIGLHRTDKKRDRKRQRNWDSNLIFSWLMLSIHFFSLSMCHSPTQTVRAKGAMTLVTIWYRCLLITTLLTKEGEKTRKRNRANVEQSNDHNQCFYLWQFELYDTNLRCAETFDS